MNVTNTMACQTIVCNSTDICAVKKVCLHGEAGSVDKLCILEHRNMVGGLQSTVGGLCTVQCIKNSERGGGGQDAGRKVMGLCRGYMLRCELETEKELV